MGLTMGIHLLGDFRLVYDDKPVTTINTPRLQSLLAYLVLHRQSPQPRHHLAFLLWPDSTEAQARTNLRHQFHLLRQALPEADRFLYADVQTLQWRLDASFTLDVADFESGAVQATSTTALQKAVELYQGDLLPSCYDDWILAERERLHQTFIEALERLIGLLENERDYSTAISYAQRLLRTDPLHEATYRHLMRLYALSGDRAGALRAYHTCATVLQRELAVEPSPATREAYERLLNTTALSVSPAAPSTALKALSPLVGRQQEWTQLQTAWRTSSGGHPHLVLLAGEAGIGKTRLAEELLQWAGRQGITTASTRCYAAEGELAYAPVTTWLRAQPLPPLDPIWLGEVARLLPEILLNQPDLSPPGPLTEAWQRQHLFEALARALLGGHQPLLLLIDDLQWCDQDTLEWLHYLLRFDPHAQLLIVGTLRSEETRANQALAQFLLALRHDGQLTELELNSLDAAETVSLATHVAGQELDSVLATHMYRETEGNPLFVVEIVRAELSGGAGEQGSRSEVPSISSASLPPRVQAVIETRLAQLSPPARELASLAATIGRAFTFAVLAHASGADEDALVRGLDELWQRRIVREQGAEAYDFSHDKLREVTYAGLSTARRRLLHRRVAQALESVHVSHLNAVSGQVATHFEQAGLLEQAIPYYQRAAEVAQQLYANEEAMEYLRRALPLLKAAPLAEPREMWRLEVVSQLHERLGDILHLTSQYAEARDAFQDALTHVPKRDIIWQARLHRKSGNTWRSQYYYEDALHAYNIAEATLGLEELVEESIQEWWQEWVQIQLERMWGYYWLGQWQEIAELEEKAHSAVKQYGTPAQRINFLLSLSVLNMKRDRYVMSEETLTLIRAALAINQESDIPGEIAWAQFVFGFALLWQGDLAESEEQMQAALRLAEPTGDIVHQSRCLTYLTINYRKRGQVEKVKDYISRSLAMATAAHMPEYVATAKGNSAWVAWRERNMVEAQTQGRAALKLWEQLLLIHSFHWVALWPLIGAALAQDQVSAAIDYARALLESAQQRLPDALTAILEEAIWAWEQAQPEIARAHLNRAIELAQEMGYL